MFFRGSLMVENDLLSPLTYGAGQSRIAEQLLQYGAKLGCVGYLKGCVGIEQSPGRFGEPGDNERNGRCHPGQAQECNRRAGGGQRGPTDIHRGGNAGPGG